ncbi:hypothetical protein ACP3V3_16935 [Vibrio sp. PNB22_3_1]
MNNATLNLSHQQLFAIEQALDLYARIGLGQLDALELLVLEKTLPVKNNLSLADAASETLTHTIALKSKLGFLSTENYGINNPNVAPLVQTAFSTKKVIKARRSQLTPAVQSHQRDREHDRELKLQARNFLSSNQHHRLLELKNPTNQPGDMVIAFREYLCCHGRLSTDDDLHLRLALIHAVDQND